jgi:hypothetical protein
MIKEHQYFRFKRLMIQKSKNECWPWIGAKDQKGYGIMQGSQISRRAHRFIYLFLTGQSGAGLVCDHICQNKSCVNPFHLRLITNEENVFEHRGKRNREKTHCLQ